MAARIQIMVGEILEEQELTIGAAAERCGVSYPAMRGLASQTSTRIDLSTLTKVCKGLKVTAGEVLRYRPR